MTYTKTNHSMWSFFLGEKKFHCEICQKSFVDKQRLEGHMSTHTGQKMYTCVKCKKTFSHASSLSAHKRSHFKDNSADDKVG